MGAGAVLSGLGWLGAIGGVGASGYELSKIPEKRRRELIQQGPDAVTGKYELEGLDALMIDQQGLQAGRDLYTMNQAKKDPRVQQAQSADPSLQLTNGMTADDFVSKYSSQIKEQGITDQIEAAGRVSDAAYNSKPQVEARRLQAQQRNDTLLASAQLRADTQQARLEDIEYRRLQDNKEDRRYNESIERMNTKDRRAAMSSLGAGIAALGAAFAL